jgi:dGTP triphosphohydrolase
VIPSVIITTMVLDQLSERKVAEKKKKYEGLSEEALRKKNHNNRRKAIRDMSATSSASTITAATAGTSAIVHGPLAGYNGLRCAKHEWKSQLTGEVMEKRHVSQKEYKAGEVLTDLCRGFAKGGLGLDLIGDLIDGTK